MATAVENAGADVGWEEAEVGLTTLRTWGVDETKYVEAARWKWPRATVFQDEKSP